MELVMYAVLAIMGGLAVGTLAMMMIIVAVDVWMMFKDEIVDEIIDKWRNR